MKNKTLHTLFTLAVAVMFAVTAHAQSSATRTTLAAAMAAGASTMTVASATGFATTTNGVNNYVLIEKDLRRVTGVSGTTITVGAGSGVPVAHPSGAAVTFGPTGNWQTNGSSIGLFLQSTPTGACTRANQQYLPAFVVTASRAVATVDCLGGGGTGATRWVAGTLPDEPGQPKLIGPCTAPIGSVAYGSMGTSTTASTTGELTASIFVPNTIYVTGLSNLNGSAVDGASKKIFILRDSSGNRLATSLLAGTLATGNDAFQQIAFTAARYVVGPAYYFVGIQDDTADVNGIRTIAAATFNNVLASSITSVFGTVAAAPTVPTTFTADTGPIACLY